MYLTKANPSISLPFFKRKFLVVIIIPFISFSCVDTNTEENVGSENITNNEVEQIELDLNEPTEEITTIEIPNNYDIISETIGDVDGDGVEDKIMVLNTDRTTGVGIEREIRIYTKLENMWSLWQTIVGPVLASESGGTMGDPFEEIIISNGEIKISHFGGSNSKWSFTHSYQFINEDLHLNSATLVYYQNCVFNETYTYDLNNNSGYHIRQIETCDANGANIGKTADIEELLTLKKEQNAPLMNGFVPGETEVLVSGGEGVYYY